MTATTLEPPTRKPAPAAGLFGAVMRPEPAGLHRAKQRRRDDMSLKGARPL